MNKLLWTVILTQLLNTLVLLFMKLLELGGQGKRRSCPPPCFLRQSLLLSLKFPCSAEQAGHQAPEIIMPISAPGLQVHANSLSACLAFYMSSGKLNRLLQALCPQNHLCIP